MYICLDDFGYYILDRVRISKLVQYKIRSDILLLRFEFGCFVSGSGIRWNAQPYQQVWFIELNFNLWKIAAIIDERRSWISFLPTWSKSPYKEAFFNFSFFSFIHLVYFFINIISCCLKRLSLMLLLEHHQWLRYQKSTSSL